MSFYWSLARGVGRLSRRMSDATARAAVTAAQERQLRRGRRAARRGVLAPGDPPPPPGADYLDYRGVATAREIAPLRDGEFPLGRWIDVRRGPRDPIGLPAAVFSRHAAVIGPTGAGKTKSVLLPWAASALRAGASVVLVDVTGDLLDDLAVVRRHSGPFNARVAKWDYTDPSRSVSWNWIDALRDDDALASTVEALIGRERPNDAQPYFHHRDRRVLRGLLEVVRATRPGATSADLLAVLHDQRALARASAAMPGSAAARRLADVVGMPPEDYARAVSGVANALEALDHPGVLAVTSRRQLDLDRLFDAPSLLVVVAPLHGTRTSEALGSLMLSQIIRTLYRRFGSDAGTHAFLVVDEAPRLAGRIDFEELLSVSRRARVSVCLAAQDVTQFGAVDERTAMLSNCSTYVGLPSVSEASARYLASRLGMRQQAVVGTTVGEDAQRGVSHASETVPVLGVRDLMAPPWGPQTAVVHSPSLVSKPFLVDLTRPELL